MITMAMDDSISVVAAPFGKRVLRRSLACLPRKAWAFGLGKAVLRTVSPPVRGARFVRRRLGDASVALDLSDFAGHDLFMLGERYEPSTVKLWKRLARESSTILDIGAHIGWFSVLAAQANPQARIVACEPCRRHQPFLRRNLTPFPRAEVLPLAVSVQTGSAEFVEHDACGGGYLSLQAEPSAGVSTQTVETRSLVDLVSSLGIADLDLVKMDIEGLEEPLLLGDSPFWERSAPRNLIVELRSGIDRRVVSMILDRMGQRGYRAQRIESLLSLPWFRREQLANWWFRREEALTRG